MALDPRHASVATEADPLAVRAAKSWRSFLHRSARSMPRRRLGRRLAQRQLLCRLIIHEQVTEARPADQRVEDLLEVLVRHAHDDRFQHEVSVYRVVRLVEQDLVKLTEQAEVEQLLPPQFAALVGRRGYEALTDRLQHNHLL